MTAAHVFSYKGTELERASVIAERLAVDLDHALDQKPWVTFMASGGRSPGMVLLALSRIDIDWGRVIVSLSDDRQVPIEHPHSNFRFVRTKLINNFAVVAKLIPLWHEAMDLTPEAALRRLSKELEPYTPFDVALIGMGMDGHTASVFPNGNGMEEALTSTRAFVSTTPVPLPSDAPWSRITISLPTLAATVKIHLMLFGSEKVALFNQFVGESVARTPIAMLANMTGNKLFLHTSL